jgi:mannose-6-phosphate isomerase-like protein (cupin superfamily)
MLKLATKFVNKRFKQFSLGVSEGNSRHGCAVWVPVIWGSILSSSMSRPKLIEHPTRVRAAGNKPKLIDEYIGRVNSGSPEVSVARMHSPGGWQEPGQTPEFDEFTVVLSGMIRVEYSCGSIDVRGGQAVIAYKGEWVRYSTPGPEGAEYFAICVPAFSMDTVHRDE